MVKLSHSTPHHPSHHHTLTNHHISTIIPHHHTLTLHILTPSPPLCVQSELELLVVGEDEGREHFSLKGILKEEGKEAGGRKKRKRRRKEMEVGVPN